MSKIIRIKKGLDISLKGDADKYLSTSKRSAVYGVRPSDFHLITPKLKVKEGDEVKAGTPLFVSKNNPEINFISPVSGIVGNIERGEKRRITTIPIHALESDEYVSHDVENLLSADREVVKSLLLESGCWPYIKQRPYDIIANPKDVPRDIFISGFDTNPLSACLEYVLKDDRDHVQAGIYALKKLTDGKVNLSLEAYSNAYFNDLKGVDIHYFSGPHPSGNVGVQIQHIAPINFGEKIWTVNFSDVAIIGKFFNSGVLDMTKTIALCGSQLKKTHYTRVKPFSNVADSLEEDFQKESRIISGNVLTGKQIDRHGYLGYYDQSITVIPEGNKHRLLGWLPFINNKVPSYYGTSLFRLFSSKSSVANTNLNGEERAIVVTGKMEKVFPFDIFPMQLLKECLAENIDRTEELGIYEVIPEDFALIDYMSTSKLEAQQIIRDALDTMIKEVG